MPDISHSIDPEEFIDECDDYDISILKDLIELHEFKENTTKEMNSQFVLYNLRQCNINLKGLRDELNKYFEHLEGQE